MGEKNKLLIVSGRFKKANIKQIKGHGLYRGQGSIEIYDDEGIKIIGRHVRSPFFRWGIGLLIWWVIATLLEKNFHVGGILFIVLCAIPAYLIVEFVILKKENIVVPWTSLKSFTAYPKRKLVGLSFDGFQWCSPVTLETESWKEVIHVFREKSPDVDATPDVIV